MAFHNNVFPKELSAINPSSEWEVQIVKLGGGAEQRNISQTDALRRYDAATPTLTLAEFRSIEKHFNARRAQGFSFPLRDRSLADASTEPLGTGGGIGSTNQLTMNMGDAGNAYNREIYLPESGTIRIFANAVEKFQTTDWTLAYSGATGGLVTWVTSVSGQSLTWSGSFFVPVRYDIKSLPDARLFFWKTDGTGLVEGPSIPLVEVRYAAEF